MVKLSAEAIGQLLKVKTSDMELDLDKEDDSVVGRASAQDVLDHVFNGTDTVINNAVGVTVNELMGTITESAELMGTYSCRFNDTNKGSTPAESNPESAVNRIVMALVSAVEQCSDGEGNQDTSWGRLCPSSPTSYSG